MLPSGIRLVTENMPGAASACIGFFIGTGSRSETVLQHGASHFLEHVLFKGTPTRAPEDISAEIEQVGGDINAYTAKEHTCFHAKVIGSDGPMAVDVLSDMLANSLIRSADLEAEREVILDEIAMHTDDPGEVAHELVSGRLLAGDALERPVIGTHHSIVDMTRRRVLNYWRRHYRPENIVVSVAGVADHDRLIDQLEEFAGQLPGPATGAPIHHTTSSARPAVIPAAVISRSRDFEQSNAVMGFRGVGVLDPRRPALNLLATILGGGMSSRLFVEVRERRGLAYAIDATEGAYSDTGLFAIEWANQSERTAEIVSVVRDQIADLLDGGITAEEVERAKGQVRGQTILGYEGALPRMSRNGSGLLIGDDRTIEEMVEAYEAVGVDELTEVARTYLSVPPVIGIVGQRPNRRKVERLLRRWPG